MRWRRTLYRLRPIGCGEAAMLEVTEGRVAPLMFGNDKCAHACGNCLSVLAFGVSHDELDDAVLLCPDCSTYNTVDRGRISASDPDRSASAEPPPFDAHRAV